jgi:hypothetical protein
MDYRAIADGMWYSGHVLTGISIVVNHYNFVAAVVIVFLGQAITMASRPVGRRGPRQDGRSVMCDTIRSSSISNAH